MMPADIYNKNFYALQKTNPQLCKKLSAVAASAVAADVVAARQYFSFKQAKSGALVPLYIADDSATFPLHSLFYPEAEAEKLLSSSGNSNGNSGGFFVCLGLGAAFLQKKLLQNTETSFEIGRAHV
jgi:hypothetical protein